MERRSFLKISGLTGGGLLASGLLPSGKLAAAPKNGVWQPNFFIKITPDNQVTFVCTQLEMGQGTSTGLSQVLADELGADWNKLAIELADGDQKYQRLQDTGGSNGLADTWVPLRRAAASTREVLIKAAARKWGRSTAGLTTEEGYVADQSSGKRLSFGELSGEAAKLKAPIEPRLKEKSEYKYIGKPLSGHRQRKISTGEIDYSIDVKLPNMVYAVIERSPVVGGKAEMVYDTDTRKVPGVLDVFYYQGTEQDRDVFRGGAREGVVVVANSTWAAIQGRKALKVKWGGGPNGKRGASDVQKSFEDQISNGVERGAEVGKPTEAFAGREISDFSYIIQNQANACMEPQNAVAHYKNNKIELWIGTQAPKLKQERIANILDWEVDQVTVHPFPCGGGFGRKFYADYGEEAALISKRINKPVKLMWTREDTISTDRYHDLRVENWKGALDDDKKLIAVDYVGHQLGSNGYRPFPYDIPNMGWARLTSPTPRLNLFTSWRSVYAHHWIFGMETFMDEMAYAAGVDPLEFRLNHLNQDKVIQQKAEWTREDLHPGRLKDALQLVADKGNWGRSMPAGSGQGLAVCSYNTSYCALLAEVSMDGDYFNVDKVVASIDCGMAINPSQVKSQIEGSILWGMSSIFSKIDIVNGKTLQSNFHDYPLPRIDQTPEIEVHIIENDYAPSGTGEPAVPVTAPAILNALYAATGKRLRKIPVLKEDLV